MSMKEETFPATAVEYTGMQASPPTEESLPGTQSDFLAILQSDQIWTGCFRYTSASYRAKLASSSPECSGARRKYSRS